MAPDIYDPRLPAIMADPYPAFRWLRAHEPVHWSRVLRGWVLTRYREGDPEPIIAALTSLEKS